MHISHRRCSAVAAVAAVLAGASLPIAAAAGSWPTYHLDAGRSGDDTTESAFSNMFENWSTGNLDGAVYAEPLVDGSEVIVATENDSVYAFAETTGQRLWGPVHLGTPRTSNFPCGNIEPLGITGTPVIDNGGLFVVAEVQNSITSFAFHLARLDPASGAVAYNVDITPAGMDANVEQERSALNVSDGNVVVAWGGLSGDCGDYHGYVETVAESNGAVQAQWHDTPSGREGGIWAPSGPAVDGSGNIYITTGNGSSTSATSYDGGDSVIKLTPALVESSYFAPGSPQPWWTLNADDTDLGSVGPELLPNNLLFAIGKGGRGYLLSQTSLPSNSDPGGGEDASAQVCDTSSDAAFGGMAVSGSTVYVPCSDGVTAVQIDSATAFHTLWHSAHGGGSPIVAGGLVWTGATDSSTALYGLSPSDGSVQQTLSLPESTQHFSTPSSADGELFMPDGSEVVAFRSLSPAPTAGGYVLDGWGGIHPYGGASAVSPSGYWPNWDIARGIVMRADRQSGYVLDGWGGVHPYGDAPGVSVSSYWKGWDIARALVLDPCDSSGTSGYVLDGWGGVHPFGAAPSVTVSGYWYDWDIARGLAVMSCSNGVVDGYVLDGWGGIHPFWQSGTPSFAGPQGAYWYDWDIARGIVTTAPGDGYVLDAFGGVHPFGSAAAATVSAYTSGAYIARGLTYNASMHGGYVLDGYGHVEPWWINGSAAIAAPSTTATRSSLLARGITQ